LDKNKSYGEFMIYSSAKKISLGILPNLKIVLEKVFE